MVEYIEDYIELPCGHSVHICAPIDGTPYNVICDGRKWDYRLGELDLESEECGKEYIINLKMEIREKVV